MTFTRVVARASAGVALLGSLTLSATVGPAAPATAAPSAAPAPASTAAPSGPGLGVLAANIKYLPSDQRAGVKTAVVMTEWSAVEPAPGRFDGSQLSWLDSQVRDYLRAGFQVGIDPGLQQAPSWVLNAAGGRLQDQSGALSTSADFEFSQAVRNAATSYVSRLVGDLRAVGPIGFYRMGLSPNAEAMYPNADQNQWWAYGSLAQVQPVGRPAGVGSSPLPGWVPGQPTWNGIPVSYHQVFRWYRWYWGALVNSTAWEIATFRSAGAAGDLHLVIPGMGALPSTVQQGIAHDLAPGHWDDFHTLNAGAAWFAMLDNLPDERHLVVDNSSTGDNSGSPRNNVCQPGDGAVSLTSPQVAQWSDARFVSYLARRHGLAVVGENPGGYQRTQMSGVMHLAASCGFSGLEWAWDGSFNGQ